MDAAKCARKLATLFGDDRGIVIVADEARNIVFIRARAETTRKALEIIQRLDARSRLCFTVIPLQFVHAAKTAKTLTAVLTLIAMLGDEGAIDVTTDQRTNSILIYATEDKTRLAKEILQRLDVKDK
jgi:type II secretory pathway component GspD/PulD (secretin)